MALFSRETLAEVFWESQNSSYCSWWGEATTGPESFAPKDNEDSVYPYPYPLRIWEVDEDGEPIQEYLVEAHDVEEAIIKYADKRSDFLMDWIDNMDVVICDDILQLAAFKEIRYS